MKWTDPWVLRHHNPGRSCSHMGCTPKSKSNLLRGLDFCFQTVCHTDQTALLSNKGQSPTLEDILGQSYPVLKVTLLSNGMPNMAMSNCADLSTRQRVYGRCSKERGPEKVRSHCWSYLSSHVRSSLVSGRSALSMDSWYARMRGKRSAATAWV